MAESHRFTAAEKLEAAARELKLRLRVYPRRIANGHMTQKLADEQIAVMKAIIEDYRVLADKERLI